VSLVFHVDVMSLEAAGSGAIWGGVWWTVGADEFPELKWNDLAVAVAVAVLAAVRDVNDGADHRRVRFFDGPFWIEFARDKAGSYSVTTSAGSHFECNELDFDGVVRQVADACGELFGECEQRGWIEQEDVRRLGMMLAV
jgi:hypothetical protein